MSDKGIHSPEDAIELVADMLKDYDREVVVIINLNSASLPVNYTIVSIGTLNSAIIHPRELLKSVILSNASAIIMIHLHPSGNLNPSKEDIQVTRRISQLCNLLGIDLTDHIITGPNANKLYSMRAENHIDTTQYYTDTLSFSGYAPYNNVAERSPSCYH